MQRQDQALVERLSYRIGVTIPLRSLVDEAADQVRQLDAMVADRPETQALVEKLELLVDNQEAIRNATRSGMRPSDMPTAGGG